MVTLLLTKTIISEVMNKSRTSPLKNYNKQSLKWKKTHLQPVETSLLTSNRNLKNIISNKIRLTAKRIPTISMTIEIKINMIKYKSVQLRRNLKEI